jgi:hypothetical protein
MERFGWLQILQNWKRRSNFDKKTMAFGSSRKSFPSMSNLKNRIIQHFVQIIIYQYIGCIQLGNDCFPLDHEGLYGCLH